MEWPCLEPLHVWPFATYPAPQGSWLCPITATTDPHEDAGVVDTHMKQPTDPQRRGPSAEAENVGGGTRFDQ